MSPRRSILRRLRAVRSRKRETWPLPPAQPQWKAVEARPRVIAGLNPTAPNWWDGLHKHSSPFRSDPSAQGAVRLKAYTSTPIDSSILQRHLRSVSIPDATDTALPALLLWASTDLMRLLSSSDKIKNAMLQFSPPLPSKYQGERSSTHALFFLGRPGNDCAFVTLPYVQITSRREWLLKETLGIGERGHFNLRLGFIIRPSIFELDVHQISNSAASTTSPSSGLQPFLRNLLCTARDSLKGRGKMNATVVVQLLRKSILPQLMASPLSSFVDFHKCHVEVTSLREGVFAYTALLNNDGTEKAQAAEPTVVFPTGTVPQIVFGPHPVSGASTEPEMTGQVFFKPFAGATSPNTQLQVESSRNLETILQPSAMSASESALSEDHRDSVYQSHAFDHHVATLSELDRAAVIPRSFRVASFQSKHGSVAHNLLQTWGYICAREELHGLARFAASMTQLASSFSDCSIILESNNQRIPPAMLPPAMRQDGAIRLSVKAIGDYHAVQIQFPSLHDLEIKIKSSGRLIPLQLCSVTIDGQLRRSESTEKRVPLSHHEIFRDEISSLAHIVNSTIGKICREKDFMSISDIPKILADALSEDVRFTNANLLLSRVQVSTRINMAAPPTVDFFTFSIQKKTVRGAQFDTNYGRVELDYARPRPKRKQTNSISDHDEALNSSAITQGHPWEENDDGVGPGFLEPESTDEYGGIPLYDATGSGESVSESRFPESRKSVPQNSNETEEEALVAYKPASVSNRQEVVRDALHVAGTVEMPFDPANQDDAPKASRTNATGIGLVLDLANSGKTDDLPGVLVSATTRPTSPKGTIPPADSDNAYIALGSNIGDRLEHIEEACRQIESEEGMHVLRTSPLYETEPMYVEDQDRFLNGVCEISTALKPIQLLDRLQAIEQRLGRVKIIDKGPRNIDLDILLYNGIKDMKTERLNIPHIQMSQREFVLRPLNNLLRRPEIFERIDKIRAAAPSPPMYTWTPLGPGSQNVITDHPQRETRMMSIINVTPDSFSDGGHYTLSDNARFKSLVREQIAAGATILDIGGQSSRPNAPDVTAEEEIARVVPAIEAIKSMPEATQVSISVDTYRAAVAEAAVKAGAHIVNDISAGQLDSNMFSTVAKLGCTYIMMHMRGTPATMMSAENCSYPNGIIPTIAKELEARVNEAVKAGIRRWRIVLDPGIGFSKTAEQNLVLLSRLDKLTKQEPRVQGFPWLVGSSRKSFIGKITGVEEPKERGMATAPTITSAIAGGADIVRVHDAREMAPAVKMSQALRATT